MDGQPVENAKRVLSEGSSNLRDKNPSEVREMGGVDDDWRREDG
jgi:hypothetical protein